MRGGQDRLGRIILAFMHNAIPAGLTEAVFLKEQAFTNFVGLCYSPQDGLSIGHVTERHGPNIWPSGAARRAGLAVQSRLDAHTRLKLTPLAGLTDAGEGANGLLGAPQHETANLLHSAAVRLLRTASAADTELDLDGPRASLLSVLVFAGPQPVTKLAELEQVSSPAITKMVSALESAGLAQRNAQKPTGAWCLSRPLQPERLEQGRAARVRTIAALLADATEAQLQTLRAASDVIAARLTSGRS